MSEKSLKQKIDESHAEPAVRRLLYWMYGDDPECAMEIIDSGYTAGNTDFANDVCSLLVYLERIKKEQDRDTRHCCAEKAMQAVMEYVHEQSVASICDGVADVVHAACMNARCIKSTS